MKKLIDRRRLLLTAIATSLLLGRASFEQKAQDSIKETTENVTQTISNDQRIPAGFARHVDGDVIALKIDGKEQKVRFLLIDIPGAVKPKTKVQPLRSGASRHTKELLSTALETTSGYDKDDKIDRYGRTLGCILVNGTLLQKMLTNEGLARVAYAKEPNAKHLAEPEQAQKQTKNEVPGVWGIPGYVTQRGFSKQIRNHYELLKAFDEKLQRNMLLLTTYCVIVIYIKEE